MIFFVLFLVTYSQPENLFGFMNDCTETGVATRAEWRGEKRRGEERGEERRGERRGEERREERREEERGEEWTELDALGSSPDGRPAHYFTCLLTYTKCVCVWPGRPGGPCQAPGPLSNGSSCLPACLP